jgi:hypothetical protein
LKYQIFSIMSEDFYLPATFGFLPDMVLLY